MFLNFRLRKWKLKIVIVRLKKAELTEIRMKSKIIPFFKII